MKKAKAITDFGRSMPITSVRTGKPKGYLPRYAVWGYNGYWDGKDEVIATGNSLYDLKQEFGDLPLHLIKER